MVSTKQPQDAMGVSFILSFWGQGGRNIALGILRSRAILYPSGEVSSTDSSIWKEIAARDGAAQVLGFGVAYSNFCSQQRTDMRVYLAAIYLPRK